MQPRGTEAVSTSGDPSRHAEVLVVEEYIPEYRRRFFDQLEAALAAESIRLTVAVGIAPATRANTSDLDSGAPYVRRVPVKSVSIAGRRLTLKQLSHLGTKPDLVIVDQALRHLENYPLLWGRHRGRKIGLWGHGIRHAKPATWVERLLERQVTRSADWFFAYTLRGAERVTASGFPRERITVVQNTFDARRLADLRSHVSAGEQRALRAELDVPPQNVCIYIGALEPPKRIGFLLEACSFVASRLPEFVLVVAGDGTDRAVVEEGLASYSWLRYVGRVDEQQKARLGAISDLLLIPGSIGLVAVDSFALQTPIITTTWPFHGPEASYLDDRINARIVSNDVSVFADVVEETLLDRNELGRLAAECAAASSRYSLETMVQRFASGIVTALATPGR